MLKIKPYSAILLALAGFMTIGMGLYFMFIRPPPLLPEDLRYMGATLKEVKHNIPGFLNWLPKVFLVMWGYIITTGILTVFMSYTSFRTRLPGAFIITFLAGITSIGLITSVNFIIGSDFKLPLLFFALLWTFALILYRIHL